MKITIKWLEENYADWDMREWFDNYCKKALASRVCADCLCSSYTDGEGKKFCNWLLTHTLNKKNRLRYVFFIAKTMSPKWNSQFPKDNRITNGIESAMNAIKSKTKSNLINANIAEKYVRFARQLASDKVKTLSRTEESSPILDDNYNIIDYYPVPSDKVFEAEQAAKCLSLTLESINKVDKNGMPDSLSTICVFLYSSMDKELLEYGIKLLQTQEKFERQKQER